MVFLSGILGFITLGVFIFAIRTSYQIERVTKPKPPGALPTFTNVFASAAGHGVAQDDLATCALVRRLRWLLLVVLASLATLALLAASA